MSGIDQPEEKQDLRDLFLEKISRGKLGKNLKMGLLLSALFFGNPSTARSETSGNELISTDEMSEVEHHSDHQRLQWPEAHLTFAKRKPDGTWEFRPDVRSIISPIQLEFGRTIEHKGMAEFDVPYEYSRLFNSASALRPEDHKKVAEYVEQQLCNEMVDALHGWNFNKEVTTWHHNEPLTIGQDGLPMPRRLEATDIRVTGFASPEGPAEQGPQTLQPGNIDAANIDLATLRAERGHDVTIEQLQKLGINTEQLAKQADNLEAKELQFSEDELGMLSAIADEAGLAERSPADGGIFELIREYNDGKLSPDIRHQLDQIVGTKRMVNVVVDYHGQRQEKLLIPIPLLLLLPLALRRRRGQDQPVLSEQPVNTQRPILVPPEPTVHKPELVPTWRDSVSQEILVTALPEQGSDEWTEIEEGTYVDDLFVYLDHEQSKELGIDYRLMADMVQVRSAEFADDAEAELWLTNEILTAWHNHDVAARREAGVDQSQLEVGLDYHRQPRQIQWAKMHARGIMEMVHAKESSPERDYIDIMADRVRELHRQRLERKKY